MRTGIMAVAGISAALIAVASVHGAAPPKISVGKLMTFTDWTVGCDNGLACQAVALMADGTSEDALSLVIARPAGTGAPLVIDISGFTTNADRYRIVIDGKVAQAGTVQPGSETIKVSGPGATKLARAMAKGKAMRLIDGSGTDLGAASLAGASAALRYIDAMQGRAGSKGAVIATGPKKAMAKTAILPVIAARRIAPTDMLPDASALVALSESSPCATERFGSTQDTAYSLGTGPAGPQALVLLNCGAGAYNFSSGVYIGQRGAVGTWTFAPAAFDYGAGGFSDDSKIPILVNTDWDAATQTISSYAKGRGIGDCGSSQTYLWDGSAFRLTSAAAMDECRGSRDWIPVWRAEMKLTD